MNKIKIFSSNMRQTFRNSEQNIRTMNARSIQTGIDKLGRFSSQRSEMSFNSTLSYGSHGIFNGANHLMIKLMLSILIGFIIALIIFFEIENRHHSVKNLNFKLARQAKRLFTDKKKLWEIYNSQLKT